MTATTIRLPPKTPKVTAPAPKESETLTSSTEEKSANDVPTSPNGKAVPKSAKPTLSPPSSTTQRPSTSRRTPSSSPPKAGSQSALSPSSSTSTTSTSSTSGKSSRPASVSLNASTSTSARAKKVMKSTLDKGLNDLCAVLPHVDRETLKSYLDRANGDYVAAIGLCMTAVKAGKL
ncbi:hypothetical protein BC938DRAFT_472010 [Jimgerdemannia flammicorona]|uniref:Uncharacterized protein n=1 Tax=Jimgerdemannia flammicorona TaxID=994334 RepID=A0A433QU90_9FUNG|nr:hypothetical protein BC938DRAFT_472010 [Jimgerdemannia flammicorona]